LADYEELRDIVFEAFKKSESYREPDRIGNFVDLIMSVRELAIKNDIIKESERGDTYSHSYGIHPKYVMMLQDILWELIIQKIVVPGKNYANLDFPFIHLTEYGKKCVNEERIRPYDPQGYMDSLNNQIPNLDPIAREYLEESLHTFNINCPRAATVMLGVASEKVMLNLIDSFIDAIQNSAEKQRIEQKINANWMIALKYRKFKKEFERIKSNIQDPNFKKITKEYQTYLDTTFQLIRHYRNDSGHPSGVTVDRNNVYLNLSAFAKYVKDIYALIDYFNNNQI